jgi:hypothetical protein
MLRCSRPCSRGGARLTIVEKAVFKPNALIISACIGRGGKGILPSAFSILDGQIKIPYKHVGQKELLCLLRTY